LFIDSPYGVRHLGGEVVTEAVKVSVSAFPDECLARLELIEAS